MFRSSSQVYLIAEVPKHDLLMFPPPLHFFYQIPDKDSPLRLLQLLHMIRMVYMLGQ